MNYLNKQPPPDHVVQSLVTLIKAHGAAGLVKRFGISWNVVMAASHGLPITQEQLEKLQSCVAREADRKTLNT